MTSRERRAKLHSTKAQSLDRRTTKLEVISMGKPKNQHVVPKGNQWAVTGAGNQKATKVTGTQKEAIEAAKTIAKNQGSDVVIHGQDGKIRDRDSYGNDPNPPKDSKH